MRHRWDYGESTARPARSRRCTACWATGRRYGYGSAPWTTYLPGGDAAGVAKTPPCPGTPWVLCRGYWKLPALPGEERPYLVTVRLIAVSERAAIERMLEEDGKPPMPEDAWATGA